MWYMKFVILLLVAIAVATVTYFASSREGPGPTDPAPSRPDTANRPPTLTSDSTPGAPRVTPDGSQPTVVHAPIREALAAALASAPGMWSSNLTWLGRTYVTIPGGAPAMATWYLSPSSDPTLRPLAASLIEWFFVRDAPTDAQRAAFKQSVTDAMSVGLPDALLLKAAQWIAMSRVPLDEAERARIEGVLLEAATTTSQSPGAILWTAAFLGLKGESVAAAARAHLESADPEQIVREAEYWKHPASLALLLPGAARLSLSVLDKLEASKDDGVVYLGFRLRLRALGDQQAALSVLGRGPLQNPLSDGYFGAALVEFVRRTDGDVVDVLPALLRSRPEAGPLLQPILDDGLQRLTNGQVAAAIEGREIWWDRAKGRFVRA